MRQDETTMPQTAQRLATYQDILDLPDHLVGEIINGELYTQPRPAPRHARASSGLGAKLANPYDYGEAAPADGGSWMSPSCIWLKISWSQTWPAGDGSVCQNCLKPPGLD